MNLTRIRAGAFALGLILAPVAEAAPPDPCTSTNQGEYFVVLRDPTPAELGQFARVKATLRQVSDQYVCAGNGWAVIVTAPVYDLQP
jgi:hypothetical protein